MAETHRVSPFVRDRFAYCADCGETKLLPESSGLRLGCWVRCPNDPDQRSPSHHARVVVGDAGKAWLRAERRLDRYAQTSCIRRRFRSFDDNAGGFVGLLWVLLLAALVGASVDSSCVNALVLKASCALFAIALAADIVLVNTAIAFVSRQPVNALRSAVLGVSAFGQLAMVFAVFYAALVGGIADIKIPLLDPLYYSVVTMVTLGYGDIKPQATGGLAALVKFVVLVQVATGLYFLTVILTTVVGWGNASGVWADREYHGWPS